MTLRIELPEELETELVIEAERLGLSLSEYALQLLRERRPAGDLPSTGADLAEYWRRESLIGTRPEIADSPAHARRLRKQAERRPHSAIAGKMKIHGEIFDSVPQEDWQPK